MEITRDMIISDVLNLDRGVVPVFLEHGLHCIGCVMSTGETIEEAAYVHGLDIEHLMDSINTYFNGSPVQA